MDVQVLTAIQLLQRQAASLLLYQSVLKGEVGAAFLQLLQTLQQGNDDSIAHLRAYGRWFYALANQNQTWQCYLLKQILKAENPFTQQIQRSDLTDLPAALVAAVRHDLRVLQQLYACGGQQLSQWVQDIARSPVAPIVWEDSPVPGDLETTPGASSSADDSTGFVVTIEDKYILSLQTVLQSLDDWADGLPELADCYRQGGAGIFAVYGALRWQAGQLVGIAHPDVIPMDILVGYEAQREVLRKNTEFLLADCPALHVLLYGSRGSGKSSLVKALLPEFCDRGLRLIEVAKSDLSDLSAIVDSLRHSPQKFIIFVDDLSFEEDEAAYKALKVLLEGNLTARPQNIVVYATSNRRHLIREFFGDRPRPRDSDEIHTWDTVQEKLSFSDRFGLTLTFEPADQPTYLKIVRHLADRSGIQLGPSELDARALQWATRHNGRSGRTARQFIDFLYSEEKAEGRGQRAEGDR